MKTLEGVGLADVQNVYSGAEGKLWELVMGQQVHIGGLQSSMDLAAAAELRPGMQGVDLCCCTGAGMRFLVRFSGASRMIGVDATEAEVALGRHRCQEEGLSNAIEFVLADVCSSALPDASADFVWGEDAWCYVENKEILIAEAARIVKPGGVIAFTDWVEGPAGLTDAEAERFLRFMKFPSLNDISDYCHLLERKSCAVHVARDTGRFQRCIDLYLAMLTQQLTYDALRILSFDQAVMGAMGEEMQFIQTLAATNKIAQALIVARRN